MPKEIIDVFALLQQMPSSLEHIGEIKKKVLEKVYNSKFNGEFIYKDFGVVRDELTIDNIYDITDGGKLSYNDTVDLYTKIFFLAKSKLRTKNSVKLLNQILDNNYQYSQTLEYIEKNGFGIEPEITTRISRANYNVSESVSLDISLKDAELVNFISSSDEEKLHYIMNNSKDALTILLRNYVNREDAHRVTREEYIIDSIIDSLDLSRFGAKLELVGSQRNDLKNELMKYDIINVYTKLKNQGVSEKDISNAIFTSLIRGNASFNSKDKFTLEELELFIGYNKIKGTKLKLRDYQKPIYRKINETFKTKQFTSVILPTGTGKSYIALAELYKHRNEEMIYLAPNVEILNQLVDIAKDTYSIEQHISDKDSKQKIIKRLFPNLTLCTYQDLKDQATGGLKEKYKKEYDLIIFDELHRTGASEWNRQINEMLAGQDTNTKILGVTATPERDVDYKNMAEYYAKKYGYTDDEILCGKHLSGSMDIEDAIRLGIVACPKVINCNYTLIKDGTMDEKKVLIDAIPDEEIRQKDLQLYEKLRRNIENSSGIEKILGDNLKKDGKYIVFLPISQKNNGLYETDDGTIIGKTEADRYIKDYQLLFRQYLFANKYLNDNPNLIDIYNKILNKEQLDNSNITYLNQEKNNILLLTKIDIKNKPSALVTKTNDLADTIINYMNWKDDILSKIEMTKILGKLTDDEVEDYSMAGSYGDKKNKYNLDQFNNKTRGKTKLMFVMNKLNEGVHAKDVSGIIWLRPLNEDSRILYLQQLGRCIHAINKNGITEEDRPQVIDLVNNTLKIKLDRGELQESIDLARLIYITNWLNEHNLTIEDLFNAEDEVVILKSINLIKNRYEKYFDNSALEELTIERKKIVIEILEEGAKIDMWNATLPNFIVENNNLNKSNLTTDNSLLNFFELDAVSRDFIELDNEISSNIVRVTIEDVIPEIKEYLISSNERITNCQNISVKLKTTGGIMGIYLNYHKKEIIELAEKGNLDAQYICNYFKWLDKKIELEDVIPEIKEYLISSNERITNCQNISVRLKTTGGIMGIYLNYHKKEIIEFAEKGNLDAQYICNYFNWLDKKIIKVVKEIKKYLIRSNEQITNYKNISVRLKTTGSTIGNYLFTHKKEIIELADSGNEDAKNICNYFKWLDKKIIKVVKEIKKYLISSNEQITNCRNISVRLETTGGTIGNYLYDHKKEIIELAEGGNLDAQYICNYFNWLDKKIIKVVEEIKEYLISSNEQITNYSSISVRLKTTGSIMGNYLFTHKKEIIELAEGGNLDAQYICNYFKWSVKDEDILKEIKEYLISSNEQITSCRNISVRLKTTGGIMGIYLSGNKKNIIELAEKGNLDAQYICNYFKWIYNNSLAPTDIEEIAKKKK